ncbi:Glycosyl hydrolase family 92 [compost metagenome]
MSAWYLFTALGFYPVAPGEDAYWIGSPLVKSAKINLENGKTISIQVKNQSEKNVYVKKVSLNGQTLSGFKLSYEAIKNGGELQFEMASKPSKQ